jgi:AcrR family transcriptional regulator
VTDRKPKDLRRDKILASTVKLIARGGLGASSMRTLAAEAGYANGALAYYFSNKKQLLRAAFEYVGEQTTRRIVEATRGQKGLAALHAFCAEMLPDDELKRMEARVVVPFWSAALTDPSFAELYARGMTSCRTYIRRCLAQAVSSRELPSPTSPRQHEEAAEMLLSILTGAQVLAVLTPKQHTPRMMWKLVDTWLDHLKQPPSGSVRPKR